MKVVYRNQQEKDDPSNESVIESDAGLVKSLEQARNEKPFFVRLLGDNGFEVLLRIGGDFGCVQYSGSHGESPNLMAVSTRPPMKRGYVEFLTSDKPTPGAARYIISFDELKRVVLDFLHTGLRSDAVVW